jgi:DNA mismatch endonuclease (patch repair protein)
MTDKLSPEHRSWNMSRIRSRDTAPELTVRSLVHRLGFQFRVHDPSLPGKPDIVFSRIRTVIFIHGCFGISTQVVWIVQSPRQTSNTGRRN